MVLSLEIQGFLAVNSLSQRCGTQTQMNTISLQPAIKGQVTANSSDGHSFLTTTPLLDGARYWLKNGANPDTSVVTVWSSGSSHWSLRSTIGQAAELTVKSDKLGKPVFQRHSDSRESIAARPYSS
jgi:hypothetical protein